MAESPRAGKDSRKREFELELLRLRQQLKNFNDEEQKLICELEYTRYLRQAQEPLLETGDSFNLQPTRLNFDNVSQRSNFVLSSPVLNPTASNHGNTVYESYLEHSSKNLLSSDEVESDSRPSSRLALNCHEDARDTISIVE